MGTPRPTSISAKVAQNVIIRLNTIQAEPRFFKGRVCAFGQAGADFCEFNVLYNAVKSTSCEAIAKQIYPNRWKKMEEYQSP
jgi:hypothetical protein